MANVPKANIKDIAYQIIAGYYPEIASGLKYTTGTIDAGSGTSGSRGAKYLRKSGFSNASIEKARFETARRETMTMVKVKGEKTKTNKQKMRTKVSHAKRSSLMTALQGSNVFGEARTAARTRGGLLRGAEKDDYGGVASQIEGESIGGIKKIWRWKGGSTTYKLYGDMVWHMQGKDSLGDRNKKMLEYLRDNKDAFKDKLPPFTQVYKDTEPQLVKLAQVMAREFFRKALDRRIMNDFFEGDMGEISRRITKAGDKPGGVTQEEMGFKTDEFEYMSFGEAKQKFPHLLDEKSEYSKANDRDMIKVNTKTGQVEAMLDVTEMPITELGHGVVETGFLDDVIKNIKPEDDETLQAVSRAVEQMFIKAINNDFNPSIRHLKDYAAKESKKQSTQGMSFDDIMLSVKRDMEKALKKTGKEAPSRASVEDVRRYSKLSWQTSRGEAYRKFGPGEQGSYEGMKYVIHMLATMGPKLADKYQQAHRVADAEGGQSVYAIIPISQFQSSHKRGLEFNENLEGKVNTLIGYSATLALAVAAKELSPIKAKNIMQAQNRNFMYQKVNGINENGRNSALQKARAGAQGTAFHSTTASYVGTKQLDIFFNNIMSLIRGGGEELEAMNTAIGGVLRKKVFSWDPSQPRAGRRLKRASGPERTQFWALPYVGIQHSEYVARK